MKTQFCCPSISKYSLSPTLKRAACRRHFATDVYFSFRENICFKSSTYISNSITRIKKWTSGWQHEGTEVLVICQGCNAFIMELLMDSWSLCPGWLRASPRSPLRAWGTRSSRRPPIAPSTDPRGTVLQGTTPHWLCSGWQWPTLPYFLWGPQGPLGVPCTVWSCRRGSATEGLDGGVSFLTAGLGTDVHILRSARVTSASPQSCSSEPAEKTGPHFSKVSSHTQLLPTPTYERTMVF
jgi:hypothetical protein